MKKISFLLVILLGLTACGNNTNTNVSENLKPVMTVLSIPSLQNDSFWSCVTASVDHCVLNEITEKQKQPETKSVKLCDTLILEASKINCIQNFHYLEAVAANNIALCDNISSNEGITQCRNNMYLYLATEKQDISYCDNFEGEPKNACINNYYMLEAEKKQDISICSKMKWAQADFFRTSCRQNPKLK